MKYNIFRAIANTIVVSLTPVHVVEAALADAGA